MVQTLSHQEETQLLGALKRAVELVDDAGLSPNAALAKVAREEDWTPGRIRLAAVAYNTGRQTDQRESSQGVLNKLASFTLADGAAIIRELYPEKVATLLDEVQQEVSSEYDAPPSWPVSKQAEALAFEFPEAQTVKVAAVPVLTAARQETNARRLHQQVERLNEMVIRAEDRFRDAYHNLCGYFSKVASYRLPFAAVESAVRAWYPKQAQRLLDLCYTQSGCRDERSSTPFGTKEAVDRTAEPFNHIDRALGWSRARAAAKSARDRVEQMGQRPFVAGRR